MAFAPPPSPKTNLGRHRQLAPLAGLHVSPICLGGMSIGDKWGELGLGQMDKEGSFNLLDAFYEAGGNFIDTANNYQDETSEKFIGEWMETKGVRDQMVIATKVSAVYRYRNFIRLICICSTRATGSSVSQTSSRRRATLGTT